MTRTDEQCPTARSTPHHRRGSSNAMSQPRPKPRVRQATPAYLERAALHYLERFSSSTDALRRVLQRKVKRSADAHGTSEAEGRAAIEQLITRLVQAGLLSDKAFALAKARRLRERGTSLRMCRQKLSAYGLDERQIDEALTQIDEERAPREDDGMSPELATAHAYAKRRRIGPYRRDERDENRQRDMGAMGRAGFSYDLARRVIDGDPA